MQVYIFLVQKVDYEALKRNISEIKIDVILHLFFKSVYINTKNPTRRQGFLLFMSEREFKYRN